MTAAAVRVGVGDDQVQPLGDGELVWLLKGVANVGPALEGLTECLLPWLCLGVHSCCMSVAVPGLSLCRMEVMALRRTVLTAPWRTGR